MISSAAGNPLVIGGDVSERHDGDPKLEAQLRKVRAEIARLIELFDGFGIDDKLTSTIEIDDQTRKTLLALHEGIVQDRPVRGTSDGSGRYDIAIGAYKIMVIIMPAEDGGYRLVIDPFDPTKRDRYRIYRLDENGSPESIKLGTAYEAVTPEDMAVILNLGLRGVVATYAALDDRAAARNMANQTVLRLLSATDLINEEHHRAYLLQGATDLCEWLLSEEPDSLIHRINGWQIQHRLGSLTDEDRRDIRSARRYLNKGDKQAGLSESCLLILLEDANELELVISELGDDEVAMLRSWPVWAIVNPNSGIPAEVSR
jgi:hypothetical protein